MKCNVSNIENNKCINKSSFIMDINILKAPLFLYDNFKPVKDTNGKIVKTVEEKNYNWIDSRNMERSLKMYCYGRLPRKFESDILHGLIGLFIKKHAPFPYNDEVKQYEININKLEFSWYELADFIKVQNSGYYIEKMKDAVRILKQTQYFSYENGVIYDKNNNKYIKSGEEGLSLISKYKFKSTKREVENDEYSSDIDNNYVIFDDLIINNLRCEYLKYLDRELFFSILPSGLSRGIYGYLEANRFDRDYKPLKYIKRSFESLRIGIPLDFDYPYELKRKLRKPLSYMIKIGYLKDYAFGDEILINNQKELCIYFCFDTKVKELKEMLTKKKYTQLSLYNDEFMLEEVSVTKCEEELKLPQKTLLEELLDRKVDEQFARKVIATKDKWEIITYIMWVDRRYKEGKVNDVGAMLSFALRRTEKIILPDNYRDIEIFINKERTNEKNKHKDKMDIVREQYDIYIKNEIDSFKNTEEYDFIKKILLQDTENNVDRLLKQTKLVGGDISKFEDFKIKKEESKYFKDILLKEIKLIKNLMTEKEFIERNR